MPVITRKIRLLFDCPSEEIKSYWDKLFTWQKIVHKSANMIASHMYMQDQVKELFYFTDETKVKLANVQKDEFGILKTSRSNTTYQLLSKQFKGDCPMAMLSGLNIVITSTYKKESKDIWQGDKSLRTYRRSVPMPIPSSQVAQLKKQEDGNYTFSTFNLKFKTFFGKDLSGNEEIIDRCASGDYKLSDSSFQIKKEGSKWKLYYLAVIKFEKEKNVVDLDKVATCELSVQNPIVIKEKKKDFLIGSAEEYLHQRLAIKGAMHRIQKACKYNTGGKGRAKKIEALERFELKEKKYVDNKMHLYSRMLIDYCLKNKIGKIVLSNFSEAQSESKEDQLLLPSWSYFNLSGKIQYKAAIHGIVVELK